MSEEAWVTTTEAAEATGYYRDYVQRLARENFEKPENERAIRVRRSKGGAYLVFLPSLQAYIQEHGKGPYKTGSRPLVDK
jgi:hypothetical protein